VVATVSADALAIVVGSVVIVAVAFSACARHLHPGITPVSATATGVASGVTGAAAAIDGPPLALLYQNDPAPVFRSTLATQFAIGTVFTVAGLVIGGQLHLWQILFGISLMPSFFVGLGLSIVIRPRLADRNLRPVVLVIAALAGVAAILRAIA
jgi:uncharacterized membrane protein YfcA